MDIEQLARFKARAEAVLHDNSMDAEAQVLADYLLQVVDEVERLQSDADLGRSVRMVNAMLAEMLEGYYRLVKAKRAKPVVNDEVLDSDDLRHEALSQDPEY